MLKKSHAEFRFWSLGTCRCFLGWWMPRVQKKDCLVQSFGAQMGDGLPETGVYHQNRKFGKMMNQGSLGNIAIIATQKTSKNRINPSRVVVACESQQCSGLPYSNKLGRHEILDDFPICSTKWTVDQEDLSYPRNQSHEKHQAWVDVPKKRDLTIKNGNVYTKDYVRPSKLVLFAHTRKSTWWLTHIRSGIVRHILRRVAFFCKVDYALVSRWRKSWKGIPEHSNGKSPEYWLHGKIMELNVS